MKIAIVHDYLTQRGGAERVVLAMARAFPEAPIHTSLFDAHGTFPEFAGFDVRPMVLDRIPGLRRHHRLAFPLLAPAVTAARIDADVVLCSSSGWAHGVRTAGRKLVYCHNPARWLYQRAQYAPTRGTRAFAATALGAPLRRWDRNRARSADRYVANSTVVRDRIRGAYGIEADVLPPPVTSQLSGPRRAIPGIPDDFLLCVSRLMPYKNVDAVVRAVAMIPGASLVVVGDGPERGHIEQVAPSRVHMLRRVEDDQLRWLYGRCVGVVAASYEDFGLTTLEAATFGRPSATLRWGGFLDTVIEDETGVYFDEPEPNAIRNALLRLLSLPWDSNVIAAHGQRFDEAAFIARLRLVIADLQGVQ
ncbi:MAG TPA: glycosyltransferase [Miltoncostaeaceae bacterium]|nr:glycosyltransferase [Miltoncostaeaceae bacterium]